MPQTIPQNLIKELKNNKYFFGLLILIFILHLLTYPSIHHITVDEERYMNESKHICNGNFSDFFGPQNRTRHTPLYDVILCITSPSHRFNLEKAEIITYSFFILITIGWYFTIPNYWKIDKKKFVILILSNSLLWIYSFRILLDVPVAFFLSLGMFNLYLFFEKKSKKNFYWGILFTSLSILTKEVAILYLPIFLIYLLLKGERSLKKYIILFLPLIPFSIYTLFQYITGFPILLEPLVDMKLNLLGLKEELAYLTVPYAHLPTIVFIIGIFSPLIIVLIFLICKEWKSLENGIKSFILFFLLFYLLWELAFDFISIASLPRFHTTLMPFFVLIISAMPMEKKRFRYIYYLILFYSLVTGFMAAYYFHIETEAIWNIPLIKPLLNKLISK